MSDYWLSMGKHASPEEGMCAMEWVAYLAGEKHTDHPKCVDPTLRNFLVAMNDGLEDFARQRLRPYLARCIGTAGDGLNVMRHKMVVKFLIDCDGSPFGCGHPAMIAGGYGAQPEHVEKAFELLEAMLPTVPLEIPYPDRHAALTVACS